VRLDALVSGDRGKLVRVGAQDRESLKALQSLGVVLGSSVEVTETDENSVSVRLGRDCQVLPIALARRLWVEGKTS